MPYPVGVHVRTHEPRKIGQQPAIWHGVVMPDPFAPAKTFGFTYVKWQPVEDYPSVCMLERDTDLSFDSDPHESFSREDLRYLSDGHEASVTTHLAKQLLATMQAQPTTPPPSRKQLVLHPTTEAGQYKDGSGMRYETSYHQGPGRCYQCNVTLDRTMSVVNAALGRTYCQGCCAVVIGAVW